MYHRIYNYLKKKGRILAPARYHIVTRRCLSLRTHFDALTAFNKKLNVPLASKLWGFQRFVRWNSVSTLNFIPSCSCGIFPFNVSWLSQKRIPHFPMCMLSNWFVVSCQINKDTEPCVSPNFSHELIAAVEKRRGRTNKCQSAGSREEHRIRGVLIDSGNPAASRVPGSSLTTEASILITLSP